MHIIAQRSREEVWSNSKNVDMAPHVSAVALMDLMETGHAERVSRPANSVVNHMWGMASYRSLSRGSSHRCFVMISSPCCCAFSWILRAELAEVGFDMSGPVSSTTLALWSSRIEGRTREQEIAK